MIKLADVFANRRVGAQLPLGFASGLPLLLTGQTLAVWLTTAGVNLKTIGAFTLVGLAYNLKVLWAPLLDRYALPFLGRRRGWLLVHQLALMAAIAALGTTQPNGPLGPVVLLASIVAFCSSSLDIVTDAYRVDVLSSQERTAGIALFTLGYRLGMLAAGAIALVLVKTIGWQSVYRLEAGLMLIGVVGTIIGPEPAQAHAQPRRVIDTYVRPFADLLRRDGAVAILCFVVLYRFAYALASPMSSPFLIKLGFTTTDLGVMQKGVGLVATLLGTLVAVPLVARLGTVRSMLIFGITQAAIHFSWVALCYTGPNYVMLAVAVGVENFFVGLATTAFDAYLMGLCTSAFSATQFAALTSLTSLGGRIFGASSGALVERLGWPLFFSATSLMALPALLLLPLIGRRDRAWHGPQPDSAS